MINDNDYFEVREIMSKVANDNSMPVSVWFSRFLKIGTIVTILIGLFLIFT
jgi:hypothetical protein